MAGRGATTYQKRLKEQQRKERQEQKFAKKLEKKRHALDAPAEGEPVEAAETEGGPTAAEPGADGQIE